MVDGLGERAGSQAHGTDPPPPVNTLPRVVPSAVAELRVSARNPSPPAQNFFIFLQFSGKRSNNRLVPPSGVGVPTSGKSWIRH